MKRLTLPRIASRARTRNRVIGVLGMHRSGTSWLAGSLQDLGLELGDVPTVDKNNAKGNRENPTIRRLHDSVLKANGGSWRRPPPSIRWPRDARRRLAAHIAEMNDAHAVWGFKDPRTLLVLDEWRRQVKHLAFVGIYRHPLAVVRSLQARHEDFAEDDALGLWRIYNQHLLDAHRADPFPVMRFDVDPTTLAETLGAMGRALELPGSPEPSPFFDPSLVHQGQVASEPIPPAVADLWTALERAAAT